MRASGGRGRRTGLLFRERRFSVSSVRQSLSEFTFIWNRFFFFRVPFVVLSLLPLIQHLNRIKLIASSSLVNKWPSGDIIIELTFFNYPRKSPLKTLLRGDNERKQRNLSFS